MEIQEDRLYGALRKWGIIRDVIDPFKSSVKVEIKYGDTPVIPGEALRIEGTQDPPSFEWEDVSTSKDSLFSLLMVDPDAPSPEHPTMSEYLHWMVTNIPTAFLSKRRPRKELDHDMSPCHSVYIC